MGPFGIGAVVGFLHRYVVVPVFAVVGFAISVGFCGAGLCGGLMGGLFVLGAIVYMSKLFRKMLFT